MTYLTFLHHRIQLSLRVRRARKAAPLGQKEVAPVFSQPVHGDHPYFQIPTAIRYGHAKKRFQLDADNMRRFQDYRQRLMEQGDKAA